jgi:ABC-type oligopeptide transport system substrate-binding subunit
VTGIAVPSDQLYSVIDRTSWETSRTANSIIQGNTFYGPYSNFVCDWMNFCTNVTDDAGNLLSFQPFADTRLRLAVCSAVNMTDAELYVMNGLYKIANGLLPPDTAPEGAYNASLTVPWKYDLKKAAELIVDAMENPRTDFTYFNGTTIPAGKIDNSFGPNKPKNIELGVPTGATDYQKIWTTIATNLNDIATRNNTGLTFTVKPVASGQLYSLAEEHRIYAYWGGWVADYNHVLDWLGPMYLSTQAYPSWNQWNIPALDNLYNDAVAADAAGNVAELVHITNQMNRIANENAYYFWLFFEGDTFIRSSFLKGWYYNPALGVEYFGTTHY